MPHGRGYQGSDASEGMVDAARVRNPGLPFDVARSEDFRPAEPVDATICLRSFYYPDDREAFFRHVAGYTRKAFVFDFRPRDHPVSEIIADLRTAGFGALRLRPFFLPQLRRLPTAALPVVYGLERLGPPALAATRLYGRVFCAAVPGLAMSLLDKLDALAPGFSAREYAEPERPWRAARRGRVRDGAGAP